MHPAHIAALAALLHAGCALSAFAAAAPVAVPDDPYATDVPPPPQPSEGYELTERQTKVSDLTLPVSMIQCMLGWNIDNNNGEEATEAQQKQALDYCHAKEMNDLGIHDVPPRVSHTYSPTQAY